MHILQYSQTILGKWSDIQIYCIFWTNIFSRKNICWFFLDQIYSEIQMWSFYHAKYIRIFICPISMGTNIIGYSFVQKKLYLSHTDTHTDTHTDISTYRKNRPGGMILWKSCIIMPFFLNWSLYNMWEFYQRDRFLASTT